ncbi:uncharacterized protein LOC110860590 [Folsomia candida]|uniref:Uncharacterized protein n=1 Tax=Folsomia candida TaxID=158441 RepID=A0A226D4M4_FOLCA|nr:uncharacterized protein LOC110860590 [Folsomia candida]OXA40492.1 hypothetical protein Fcan01_24803 [Folsomia candida]
MLHIFLYFAIFSITWIEISSAPTLRHGVEEDEEAVTIALELTRELIPDSELVSKIRSDLRLIRRVDPALKKLVHHGRWHPGQLVTRGLTPTQVKELEESEFKPVKVLPRGNRDVVLLFKKPYHPEHLAKLVKFRFGFDSKPNYVNIKEGRTRILYRGDLSTYFWNSVNGKNCLDGCDTQYSVSFKEQEVEHDYRFDSKVKNLLKITNAK